MSDTPQITIETEAPPSEESAEESAADAVATAAGAVATAAAAVDMAAATVEREENQDDELWQALSRRFDALEAQHSAILESQRITAEAIAAFQGQLVAGQEMMTETLSILRARPLPETQTETQEATETINPAESAGARQEAETKRRRLQIL